MAEQLLTLKDIDYSQGKIWPDFGKEAIELDALRDEARKWLTALDNMEKEEDLIYKTQFWIKHFFNLDDTKP